MVGRSRHAPSASDATAARGPRAAGVWFNPTVPARPPRPRPAVVAATGALLAAVVLAGIVVVRPWQGRSSAAAAAATAPVFVDDTASAGIDHAYDGEFGFFVGGGVAVFDCDADGRADLFFAGGTEPASLYRNQSALGGALRFAAVPSPVTDLTDVTGAYPLDVDSDGQVDLAVLRRGPNAILRGLGDCRFEDATQQLGLDPGDDWTTAFSATWEGSNALPTLAFGNYLVPTRDLTTEHECSPSWLVRPGVTGQGYREPVALAPGFCTLSVLFSDWGRTGRRDLRVSNDRHYYTDGSEQMWRVEPDAKPRLYGEADGWRRLQIWGMGIASQDVTGDGYPEVFLTSQGDNKLQTLAEGTAQPTYRDIALRAGVTAQRPFTGGDVLPSTAWHPQFEDVNNDGWWDLFVTKGNVEAQPDHAMRDPNNLLIGRADGTFAEAAEAAGIVDFTPSRGAAVVDLNLDGLLDIVVVHRRQGVTLWRNVGRGDATDPRPMGHWLAVRLHQPAPNVDAIGAWLEVRVGERTVVRELTVGGGHASGQLGWVHVGLGDADEAEVRVQWPDGELGPWAEVPADSFVIVDRGRAEPTIWHPEPKE